MDNSLKISTSNRVNLVTQVEHALIEHQLIAVGDTIIVGFSGGPDSTFLLHALCALREKYRLTLIAAHCNHGWRPEADAEEEHCRNVAAQYKVVFEKAHARDFAQPKWNGSKEEIGRKLRRTFFDQCQKKFSAHAIALAHHADDQRETFFIRMMRGTSLEGLVGMKWREKKYVRPLLDIRKQDIEQYLGEHSIAFCVDQTNNSPNFLRSALRTQVFPALDALDTRSFNSWKRTHAQLQRAHALHAQIIDEKYAQLCQEIDGKIILDAEKILQEPEAIQDGIFMRCMIASQTTVLPSQKIFHELRKFMESSSSTHTIGTWKIYAARTRQLRSSL